MSQEASAAVPERPWLKPWYRLADDGDRFVLQYGHSAVVLEGKAVRRLLPAVLPLLDGTRTVEEVTARIGEAVGPAVEKCLVLLARHGLLTAGPPPHPELPRPFAETAAFFGAVARSELSPSEALHRIASARVGLVGGGPPAVAVARLLRLAAVEWIESLPWAAGEDALAGLDLVIAVPEGDELPRLDTLNRSALAARVDWLTLLPFDGRMAAIGPLFVPGETSCYLCYRLRRAANVSYSDDYLRLERQPARYPMPPFDEEIVAGLGVRVALGWLVERDPSLPGAFYAYEQGETLTVSHHVVYRVPRCPACSARERLSPPLPWHGAEG